MIFNNNKELTCAKHENISFINSKFLSPVVTKEMHKNGSLVYSKGDIDIMKVPTGNNHFVIIKFRDVNDDETLITMIYDTNDKVATKWAILTDGYSSEGTTNIHHIKEINENVKFYLTFEKSQIALSNQYAIDFDDKDSLTPDSLPNYATALLFDKE